MRVVVFSPSDSYSRDALPSLREGDVATVVRWSDSLPLDDAERITVKRSAWFDRVTAIARRNVIVRMIVRASPLDAGAQFWRATRSDPQVIDAVRRADILVSPERDGGFAAWSWHRRAVKCGRKTVAVAGYPAARAAIERSR